MKASKNISLLLIIIILAINIISYLTTDKTFVHAQRQSSQLSVGENYYGRLRLWYLYAQSGDWANASRLESMLRPADLLSYQTNHQPQTITQRLENISSKTNRTADDWLEIAKLQLILGQKDLVISSLNQARALDPVREDISRFYYEINR